MLDIIWNIIAILFALFFVATIIFVILQTILEKYNDSKIEINKKTENIIIIALMIILFIIGLFYESTAQKRDNKIKELINTSKTIEELKEELFYEGIYEDI